MWFECKSWLRSNINSVPSRRSFEFWFHFLISEIVQYENKRTVRLFTCSAIQYFLTDELVRYGKSVKKYLTVKQPSSAICRRCNSSEFWYIKIYCIRALGVKIYPQILGLSVVSAVSFKYRKLLQSYFGLQSNSLPALYLDNLLPTSEISFLAGRDWCGSLIFANQCGEHNWSFLYIHISYLALKSRNYSVVPIYLTAAF